MKKIIFVNRYFHPDLSATSQMLSDLAFALASTGVSVCVVTSRQTYEDSDARLPAAQTIDGVEVRRIWTTKFGRMNLVGRALDYLSFYIAAFFSLLIISRAGDVIVAKTDPPLISVVCWVVAKARRAKLINWLQDIFPEVATGLGVLKSPFLSAPIRWIRNISLRGADVNVVLGERMRALITIEGADPQRTKIIHNWANGDLIRPIEYDQNALRTSWGLQGKFVVGYSGNMGRAHEFDTIVEAMGYLQGEPDIVFLFIGGGASKVKLMHAIAELGITNYQFQPYQPREDLSESLGVPNVHLVSLQPQLEGLIVPSKIYGIAAAGRSVIFIGDQDGEVARLITRCGSGYSMAPGAGEKLGRRLLELKRDPATNESLGEHARDCLEKHYEKSHAIVAWRSVLLDSQ